MDKTNLSSCATTYTQKIKQKQEASHADERDVTPFIRPLGRTLSPPPFDTCAHVYAYNKLSKNAPLGTLTPLGMSICLKILRHPTCLIGKYITSGRPATAYYTRQYTAVTSLLNAHALNVSQRPMTLRLPGVRPMAGGPSHSRWAPPIPLGRTAVSPKGGIFCVSTSQKKRAKL
jgi:hypothetical protein